VIDLRSDTQTQPSRGMREAMRERGGRRRAAAQRTRPSTRSSAASAELLGQEEAVFLPTATMANEIALRRFRSPATS
jgi:threonine aldolase